MIKLLFVRIQTSRQIPKALSVGELAKTHTEKLMPTAKAA
jgi:hypothetical protein